MTPTERAAVAEAIAALEPLEHIANSHERESDNFQSTTWLTKGGMRQYLTVKNARSARTALASLRAVAPASVESKWHPGFIRAMTAAPADQSDAGRDGVIEECAVGLEKFNPDGRMQISCNNAAAILRSWKSNRALAGAAKETPGQICEHDWRIWPETDGQEQKCMKCGAYRRTPSETVGPGELETEVEELRALVGKLNGGAEMQELMRLNNGLTDKVRNLTTLLDQQLGTPCEQIRHAQEVERLQALVLSTTDRDAIREAMQGALDFIKGPTTGGYEHIVKLTAALELFKR